MRVVDAGGEPVAMAARILGDLGASVTKVEPIGGSDLRRTMPFAPGVGSLRHAAWDAGKTAITVADPLHDARLDDALRTCHVVLATPGWDGVVELDRDRAPQASWVDVTPF